MESYRVNKITSVIEVDENPRELEQYVKVIFRCTCVRVCVSRVCISCVSVKMCICTCMSVCLHLIYLLLYTYIMLLQLSASLSYLNAAQLLRQKT